MKIGILIIATNKYKQFVQPLIDSAKENLFPGHQVTFHLFTDDVSINYEGNDRIQIKKYLIPSYKFPLATLYRYKIFTDHRSHITDDFTFYTDVDMRFDNPVGDELLVPALVAVHHPGFYISKGWGSGGCSTESLAYLPTEKRINYCAGGFQGGKNFLYMEACAILASRIADDEARNVMAEWHDETHWNWLLNNGTCLMPIKMFSPEYCMVEQQDLREKWGIANLVPRIVALKKNHEEIRS